MNEITELDMNKYYIFKREDVNNLSEINRLFFRMIKGQIDYDRATKGKKDNKYLVLNMDDEIDLSYLIKQTLRHDKSIKNLKVKDIAVALVNAILKAKEK